MEVRLYVQDKIWVLTIYTNHPGVDYEKTLFPSSKTRDTKMATRPRFARLAASPLPRASTALTKSDEKERLLAV